MPTNPDCQFCHHLAPKDIVSTVVFMESSYHIVRPLGPVTEGHVLVVPTRHIRDAASSPEIAARCMQIAAQYVYDTDEIGAANIITSIGADATQTVFHLHVHVVPRSEDDGLALPWTDSVDLLGAGLLGATKGLIGKIEGLGQREDPDARAKRKMTEAFSRLGKGGPSLTDVFHMLDTLPDPDADESLSAYLARTNTLVSDMLKGIKDVKAPKVTVPPFDSAPYQEAVRKVGEQVGRRLVRSLFTPGATATTTVDEADEESPWDDPRDPSAGMPVDPGMDRPAVTEDEKDATSEIDASAIKADVLGADLPYIGELLKHSVGMLTAPLADGGTIEVHGDGRVIVVPGKGPIMRLTLEAPTEGPVSQSKCVHPMDDVAMIELSPKDYLRWCWACRFVWTGRIEPGESVEWTRHPLSDS